VQANNIIGVGLGAYLDCKDWAAGKDTGNKSALYISGAEVGRSVASDVILGPWRDSDGPDLVDVMLDVDTRTYLPGDLLVKMDVATMAHSLEARSPLLDHELMQLAASLPPDMKVRGTEKKVGLRAAMRGTP